MSCFRRFVNLVSSDGLKGVYTLRRIDMSRFFHPTTTGTTTINGTTTMKQQQDCLLPDPVINFYSSQDLHDCGDMDFMLVDDKVVARDGTGGAFFYDTAKHALRSLTGSHAHARFKTITTSLAVDRDLYVIDRLTNGTGSRSFQALVYTPSTPPREGNWHWRLLPPPPPPSVQELEDRTSIDSCAAVGSRIWMSAIASPLRGGGKSCTHLFDTQGLVWSKQPADWVLPFTGSAQYVPELQKLWFGISSRDHGSAFCAANLATASLSRPPVLHTVFDDAFGMAAGVAEDCLISAHAVHLGSGRFCIARFFSVVKKPDGDGSRKHPIFYKNELVSYEGDSQSHDEEEIFVVLAGVQVVSGGDGELSLVKHHSERYMFLDHELLWVL